MFAHHRGVSQSLSWVVTSCFGSLFVGRLIWTRKTRSHLEYLHLQILSIVTASQLRRIFERRTNFDLRRLLDGTIIHLHFSLKFFWSCPKNRFGTIFVFVVRSNGTRPCNGNFFLELSTVGPELASACCWSTGTDLKDEGQTFCCTWKIEVLMGIWFQDTLYIILVARGQVITLVRPKKHSIHPAGTYPLSILTCDLHIYLLQTYTFSSIPFILHLSWTRLHLHHGFQFVYRSSTPLVLSTHISLFYIALTQTIIFIRGQHSRTMKVQISLAPVILPKAVVVPLHGTQPGS